MIPDIKELNFPKKDEVQYATLTQASAIIADMGEKTITTQVKIDGDIVPDFSYDWEVEFQGEKYIMPLRIPQGTKQNTSLSTSIDLMFQHWAIYQLKRWPFVTLQHIAAGTYLPNEEEASIILNLGDFCKLFGQVLEYYYGGKISIDLNTEWEYDSKPTAITISHTKIWNVLTETLFDKYGVRWEIKAAEDNDNTTEGGEKYVIRVGYPTRVIDHIFEYGFEGGLLKVERQVQSDEIRNILKGRGGDTNIPFRYFKNIDSNNPDFSADPDWVEELSDIYFANLMGATFRSYVQGWKAKHISQYHGYTAVGESNAYAPWAYRKGYNDEKFAPVEFVADEIRLNPVLGGKRVEIMPGYSPYVVAGSSLDKYGALPDTLDNNDDIYPTIQDTGLDIAIDVEQVTTDSVEDNTPPDVTIAYVQNASITVTLAKDERRTIITPQLVSFSIPEGMTGNLIIDAGTPLSNSDKVEIENYDIRVYNKDGSLRSASGIPGGEYKYDIKFYVHNMTSESVTAKFGAKSARLQNAVLANVTGGTFDIWVKNIWSTSKKDSESNTEYAERVWKPIFGNREGDSAKVMFTSGALAISEDYEFVIVGYPEYDTSKSLNGDSSHWKIKLAKSDSEFEATGLYVPSTKKQGRAGDTFVFIGTEMTHVPYIVDAEVHLDNWKKDVLNEKKEIKPTFVVTTDRVRMNNEGKAGSIISQLHTGCSVTLQDKRFIEGSQQVNLYLQSITYTYREPSSDDTALNPDIELVLSNEYTVSANPISAVQSEVSAIQKQLGSLSNVSQSVRLTGDKVYLRKDKSDRTPYSLSIGGKLTTEKEVASKDFADGQTGKGYKIDEVGNGWFESLSIRRFLEVPELRYNRVSINVGNQWRAAGGGIILSVTPDEDSEGNVLMTGTATLHLEDGEIGLIAVDDICQGIYHDGIDIGNNESYSFDDGIGNFGFAGFATTYFRITEILEEGRRSKFRYALRAKSEKWNKAIHPCEAMHFVCYGNFTDKNRQVSRYSTLRYERYLKDVNDWEFGKNNIGAQIGDLSNLSLFGMDMTGYSAYLNNIYMSGVIEQFANLPLRMEVDTEGEQFLAYGESLTATCTVLRGWEDLTKDVVRWEVIRDSADPSNDAAWLLRDKVKNFKGKLEICYDKDASKDDLGNMGVLSTLFTFRAYLDNGNSTTFTLKI